MVAEMIIALTAGIDQVAKTGIEHCKEEFPREVKGTGGKLWLYQNQNEGFPFGFLQEYKGLTHMVPVVVTSMLGGVFLYLKNFEKKPAKQIALALIIGGSLSNILDRYLRGYVVDYFSVSVGVLKKIVLNLGDLCVFIGTVALAIMEMAGAVSEMIRHCSSEK